MPNQPINPSNQSFDPSKFSLGGITRPILYIFIFLSTTGIGLLKVDRIIAIITLIIAVVILISYGIAFTYLLLKDPIKLRSEKHEQRMMEIEKQISIKSISD